LYEHYLSSDEVINNSIYAFPADKQFQINHIFWGSLLKPDIPVNGLLIQYSEQILHASNFEILLRIMDNAKLELLIIYSNIINLMQQTNLSYYQVK
jgi:hypothetical protein